VNVEQLPYLLLNDFGMELFIASLNYVLYHDKWVCAIETILLLTFWLILRSQLWSFRRYPRSVYYVRLKNINFRLIRQLETERSLKDLQTQIQHTEAALVTQCQPDIGFSFQFRFMLVVLFYCRLDLQSLYSSYQRLNCILFQSMSEVLHFLLAASVSTMLYLPNIKILLFVACVVWCRNRSSIMLLAIRFILWCQTRYNLMLLPNISSQFSANLSSIVPNIRKQLASFFARSMLCKCLIITSLLGSCSLQIIMSSTSNWQLPALIEVY
jgi:hypothetical protein